VTPRGFFFFFPLSPYAFPPKEALGYEAETPRVFFFGGESLRGLQLL